MAATADGRPGVHVMPFRTKDGAIVSARVTVTALAGASGDTTGYAFVAVPDQPDAGASAAPAAAPADAGPVLDLPRLVERLVGALDSRDGRFEALLKEHARTFQVLLRQVHESPAAVAGRAVVANAAPPPAPAPPADAPQPPSPVPPAPVPPRDASAPDLPVHGSLRVLVVEDNVVHQRVAVRKLKQLGHRADTAPNGSEALAMMTAAPYDFVLMDCEMPVMDGFEATRRIRSSEMDGRHVLIVALTGHQSAEAHAQAIAAGMDDLLEKPLRLSELEGLIARHRMVPSLAS